jgi:hypothetical protein
VLLDVPVDPDAPQAREWLLDELSKAPYQAAKPTALDLLAQQVAKWFGDLFDWLANAGGPGGRATAPVGLVVVLAVVVAIVVVAFLIYGLPRLNRRSGVTGALFGDDDDRDSAAMRGAAERAAADGDYTTAIAELFRAIARGLAERSLVTTFPGTTAREFARRAGTIFPASAAPLAEAARSFDGVRYLDQTGTAAEWDAMLALDGSLRAAKPVLDEAGAPT